MRQQRCAGLLSRLVGLGDNDYNNLDNVNANNQCNNNGRARGIASKHARDIFLPMKTYKNLYSRLISLENLENAYWKARKHKSNNPAVREFEKHWRLYLIMLHLELKNRTYAPQPLKTFILRDPKTRRICVSQFRDRVVHHALINILQPIFEPRFIHDSYASRKGKGTLAALRRFDVFLRKVTRNGRHLHESRVANDVQGFAFKADIKHYFDTVDHTILISIIRRRIKDEGIICLTKTILNHYHANNPGKGMPLGNWTSQFFANVYLNELDQFVKHQLKAKYYLRYVDDFVILHHSKETLEKYQRAIAVFLGTLQLEMHPNKCGIIPLQRGISLLGFRVFYYCKLIRRRNLRKICKRLDELLKKYRTNMSTASDILETLQGWNAYALHGNTHRLRTRLTTLVEQELQQRDEEWVI